MSTPWTVRSRLARVALVASMLGLASLAGAAPVGAADAITLTTPYPAIAVAPGATPSFDISVKTATPGRVDLLVGTVPDGWTALLHGGGYTIDSVESPDGTPGDQVTLNVTVPADAAGGTQRIDVKGTTAGGASATLTVELRVSPNAAGDVTLTTDFAAPQGRVERDVHVHADAHQRHARRPPIQRVGDWSGRLDRHGPDGLAGAGGQRCRQGRQHEPGHRHGQALERRRRRRLPDRGRRHEREPVGARTTSRSTITGSYSLTLSTTDRRLNTNATAGSTTDLTLVVANNGTADVAGAAMSATAPSGWTVKFDPATADVPAGQQVQVVAHVTPSADAIAGDYVTTFKATAAEANASTDIRVTIETSVLWGAIGIGLIVARARSACGGPSGASDGDERRRGATDGRSTTVHGAGRPSARSRSSGRAA